MGVFLWHQDTASSSSGRRFEASGVGVRYPARVEYARALGVGSRPRYAGAVFLFQLGGWTASGFFAHALHSSNDNPITTSVNTQINFDHVRIGHVINLAHAGRYMNIIKTCSA